MPSQRWADRHGIRHTRQMLLQVARWLPDRRIVAVADSGFSATDLLDTVSAYVCVVTQLRLDARLFAPPALACQAREVAPRSLPSTTIMGRPDFCISRHDPGPQNNHPTPSSTA